ncbi:STAS domain-containing protein [Ruania suaedae]|uniref:STAS domain-containing protein n=1 Tax=Ruania suaedae TaxID=2897774 RepID=UPI001E3FF60C|nr:STAS domain-containing protein [Ruania suaedae]UFU02238.1 STAS domain-containing protein [Ruania suaedae]
MTRGKVWVFSGGARTIVILKGDLDATVTDELYRAIDKAEAAAAPVQVDACGLVSLDSTGISAVARLAARTPAPLTIFGAPDTVRFLLEVTHLHDLVTFVSDDAVPEPL